LGATKLGETVFAPVRPTAGPEIWLQEYVAIDPSGSELALPFRVTVALTNENASGPALAVGKSFKPATGCTETATVSQLLAPPLSVTVILKVRVTAALTEGATNPAVLVLVLLKATVVPDTWLQA